jgi:hypothetical protein
MKTTLWQKRARIEGVAWDFELVAGRLDAWRNAFDGRLDACRNGMLVKTVYSDGREALWSSDPWPEEIVAAWQEMLDVMRREAGR